MKNNSLVQHKAALAGDGRGGGVAILRQILDDAFQNQSAAECLFGLNAPRLIKIPLDFSVNPRLVSVVDLQLGSSFT